jgi:hypothetical protein
MLSNAGYPNEILSSTKSNNKTTLSLPCTIEPPLQKDALENLVAKRPSGSALVAPQRSFVDSFSADSWDSLLVDDNEERTMEETALNATCTNFYRPDICEVNSWSIHLVNWDENAPFFRLTRNSEAHAALYLASDEIQNAVDTVCVAHPLASFYISTPNTISDHCGGSDLHNSALPQMADQAQVRTWIQQSLANWKLLHSVSVRLFELQQSSDGDSDDGTVVRQLADSNTSKRLDSSISDLNQLEAADLQSGVVLGLPEFPADPMDASMSSASWNELSRTSRARTSPCSSQEQLSMYWEGSDGDCVLNACDNDPIMSIAYE